MMRNDKRACDRLWRFERLPLMRDIRDENAGGVASENTDAIGHARVGLGRLFNSNRRHTKPKRLSQNLAFRFISFHVIWVVLRLL